MPSRARQACVSECTGRVCPRGTASDGRRGREGGCDGGGGEEEGWRREVPVSREDGGWAKLGVAAASLRFLADSMALDLLVDRGGDRKFNTEVEETEDGAVADNVVEDEEAGGRWEGGDEDEEEEEEEEEGSLKRGTKAMATVNVRDR